MVIVLFNCCYSPWKLCVWPKNCSPQDILPLPRGVLHSIKSWHTPGQPTKWTFLVSVTVNSVLYTPLTNKKFQTKLAERSGLKKRNNYKHKCPPCILTFVSSCQQVLLGVSSNYEPTARELPGISTPKRRSLLSNTVACVEWLWDHCKQEWPMLDETKKKLCLWEGIHVCFGHVGPKTSTICGQFWYHREPYY